MLFLSVVPAPQVFGLEAGRQSFQLLVVGVRWAGASIVPGCRPTGVPLVLLKRESRSDHPRRPSVFLFVMCARAYQNLLLLMLKLMLMMMQVMMMLLLLLTPE